MARLFEGGGGFLQLTTAKTTKQTMTLNISNNIDLHKNVVRVNIKTIKDVFLQRNVLVFCSTLLN